MLDKELTNGFKGELHMIKKIKHDNLKKNLKIEKSLRLDGVLQ